MSVLLDKILDDDGRDRISVNINGRYYIAKCMRVRSLKKDIKFVFNNIKDSLRVLRGKSFAVHYKEDEWEL